MPNEFHKLLKLGADCGCEIVQTTFPASEAEVDGASNYNTAHWQRVGGDGTGDGDGGVDWTTATLDQTSGDLEINGIARLKWIGSCPKYTRGIRFELFMEALSGVNSSGWLLYGMESDFAYDTGYRVTWRPVEYPDLAAASIACDLEIRYNGTVILSRNIGAGYHHAGAPLTIAFEHVSDDDGGGVHIMIGGVGTFTHLAGPQLTATNACWGIGGTDIQFNSLVAEYNGNATDGSICTDCPVASKGTGCDLTASCGGGTYIVQPGENVQDYDWSAESCSNVYGITPYQDAGWYKVCNGDYTGSLNYSAWTFASMSATADFSTYGMCGSGMPGDDAAYQARRFFRVTNCSANVVTLTIHMQKSKWAAAAASISVAPVCGVTGTLAGFGSGTIADLPPLGLSESWPVSTTASYTATTTCSGTVQSYFVSDICVMDDEDTVTIDLENLPPGIYVAIVSGTIGAYAGYLDSTVYTAACSGVLAQLRLPVQYDFDISGDALAYDPICR